MSSRRWLGAMALTYTALVVSIIVLADTDRLTPMLDAAHGIPFGDKVGHLVLMGMLALVVDLALGARTLTIARVPLRVGTMIVLALVVLEELSQRWVPSRRFDLGDLAADVIGIAIGGAIASLLARRSEDARHASTTSPRGVDSGARATLRAWVVKGSRYRRA